jgi:hypothetical protein
VGDGALLDSDSDEAEEDEAAHDTGDEADAELEADIMGVDGEDGASMAPSPLARLPSGAHKPWSVSRHTRFPQAQTHSHVHEQYGSSDDEAPLQPMLLQRRLSGRRRPTKDRLTNLVTGVRPPFALSGGGASLPRALAHQESLDSIDTVVGGPRSFVFPGPAPLAGTSLRRTYALSTTESPIALSAVDATNHGGETNEAFLEMTMEERHSVIKEEERFRQMGWDTLRDSMETLADQACILVFDVGFAAHFDMSGRRANKCHPCSCSLRRTCPDQGSSLALC